MSSQNHKKLKGFKDYEIEQEPARQIIQEPYAAKKCFFYRDGDTKFKAVMLCIHPRKYRRLETLCTELSTKVKLPFGVRSIFTPKGRDMITSLDHLENGESYVCSQLRHQARGIDPNRVVPPPLWNHNKPSNGSKELAILLKEHEFRDKARYVGRRYSTRDQRMARAYNRNPTKKITVLKNGEPKIRHVVLINRHTAQKFEQILTDISDMFGKAIWKLYTVDGRRIRDLPSLINGPDVLVAAGKEHFITLIEFHYDTVESEVHNRIRDYERSESRLHSRMEMRRMSIRSRLDSNRMDMRSRLDSDRMDMRSRLGSNHWDSYRGRAGSRLTRIQEKRGRTKGHWKVWCTTNELPSAGTTAQVTITVYGHKGNSGPIPLGFPDGKSFQPGQVDEFDLNTGSNIGDIYKIRIAHDNTGDHPGWFCDEIRMHDEDTDEILVFPCRRWLSRDEGDREICREIPANKKGEPQLPVITYEVTVVTGDLWNGGTQSNVYLTIYGDRGDSGVRQLYVSNKKDAFSKGQTNHFTVEAVSLGHLKRVIVGHDGTTPGDGWFLEKLSIQEPDAKPHEVHHFYCGRWLDEGEDDGKIVRELKIQDDYMEDILEKRNWEYEKWKFESKTQVILMSVLTGKALRVKPDGTVDGLGDDRHPGSTFTLSSKKPMVRVFTSLFNNSFHLAIDQGKVTGQGRGGPLCEFRLHVQSDRTVMLEGVKSPLQFVTLQENGKLGDPRSVLDKDPAKRFHVYVRGVLRHRGIIMLRTSNIQAISVDHDKSVYATGRCNRAAHFRVHKVEEGGVRMFESIIYPGFFLRLKDGKFDCSGSRNDDSHFLVEAHKHKGYYTLQLNKLRGTYVGFTSRGEVRPTYDSGTNNVHIFPQVIEYGTPKHQLTDATLTPISERTGYDNSPGLRTAKQEAEDGDFRVLVSTSENLEQGQVLLAVFGDKGSTGPIALSKPKEDGPRFKAGSTDEFKVNLAKIGKIFKVRLEVIPENQIRLPSWKVQKVVLVDMNTQERHIFNFNCWLSGEHDDQELIKELPLIRPGSEKESLPIVTYYVTVYTGTEPGSETNAQIYINMFGDFGDSGKRFLRFSDKAELFRQGQSDTFQIEAVHLGNLHKIQIGHNETRPKEGWFCDKVVIREGKTANMEFVFPCGRWLDSGMEDRKLERTLMIQEPLHTKTTSEVLHLRITTHSDSGASVQDTVLLYVYGKNGSAGPLTLGSGRDGLFKPGATDEIMLELDQDVGKLYKVRIGLAEERTGNEWHLEKMMLQQKSSEEEFDFDVGRWMSRKKEDCDVWRELPVLRFEESALPVIIYTVEVHTSNIPGADTSAAIYINLIGQRGDSGNRRLYVTQTEGKMFSQGKIDRFLLEAVSLGAVKSVVIGHSEKKPGQGWHLDYVAVKEYNLNDEQVETFFPCDRWFDAGQDDQKTEREIFPGKRPKITPKSNGEYCMWIRTADDSEPASGGKATLVIYGDKGTSGDIALCAPNSTAELFEPSNVDEFELRKIQNGSHIAEGWTGCVIMSDAMDIMDVVSTGDIGDIYKIRITREDKEDWKAWHLEEIKLEDKTTREVFIFHFDRWLSRDRDDGDLSRELPVISPERDSLAVKRYEVLVMTGDHWAAGTDASVYMTIFGSKGDSGRRLLHKSKSGKRKFQRAKEDIFIIEAVDLKDIEYIVVGHDGKGPGAGWFLQQIIIKEVGCVRNIKRIFPCGNWLDEGEADGKTERKLRFMDLPKFSASSTVPSECGGHWKVKVKTTDFPEADTQAQVYITIHGTKDYSQPVPLGDGSSTKNTFSAGKESVFDVTVGEIGELAKIRLEHDSRNKEPAWHVDWVHMKHLESGFECLFTFDQWLAEDKADGQVFRERALESPGWMPAPVLHYIILIETGRKPNSGAHGGVCTINLLGSQGVTGQQTLSRPLGTSIDCMKDGILDVYVLEAVCVGELRNIRLGFRGRNRAKRWFVESIRVMESLSALTESVFTANVWLDDDEQKTVVLPLSETCVATSLPRGVNSLLLGHDLPESKGNWELWVWTASHDGAGTKAVITLVLYGTTGASLPIDLNKRSKFYAGSHFHTYIESGAIGELFKIRLAFADGTGNSWFLERIKLKDCDTKQEFIFDYNDWLHCTEDSQDRMIELPAIRPDIAPLAESTYKVSVMTGDLPCAETMADVTLMMIGQWGDSGQCHLTKPVNNREPFNRGQTDEFELKLLSLGKISKILLGHSSYGWGHGWFCQQVSISSIDSRGDKMETLFLCNRWFDTGVGDRQTACEFSAMGTVSLKDVNSPTKRAASSGIWTCCIVMANVDALDVSQISHDAPHQAYLVVYGSKGVSDPLKLEDGKNEQFLLGQTYSFKGLKIGAIGNLTKLRISYSSKDGTETVWAIKEVLLEETMTSEKLQFNFSRHVGEISDHFTKEMPVLRPGSKIPPLVKYIVKTETADMQYAGTTAKVYVTLYGQKGDSGQRLLQTMGRAKPFKQGKEETFEIEVVDLGSLEKLVVTKGPGDPWLLKQMIVKAGPFGPIENIFTWNQWIGEVDKRDQEVQIIFPVVSSRPSRIAVPITEYPDFPVTRGQWNVEVLTGHSGTTGDATDIVIVFCGRKQESRPFSLNPTKNRLFQPGAKDDFEVCLTEDVGELMKIRLGFEDNSNHKKWHLQKIKFEDSDTKDTFSYAPNDWLTVSDISDGWLEFPVIWPGVFIFPIIKYTIIMETDVPETGSVGEILVKLDGQMGSTGFRILKDKSVSLLEFQQRQTTRSTIEAVSLMALNSVTIGHTNKQPGSGWFLYSVIVRPSDEKEDYVFGCNRWLDAGQEDGETIRTLFYNNNKYIPDMGKQQPVKRMHVGLVKPLNVVQAEKKPEPPTTKPKKAFAYDITTVTGRESGNGTTAQIVLILYGDQGHSEPLFIEDCGQVTMKEGEIQHFEISTDADLGDLYKVRVGFNAEGHETEWYGDLNSCPSWFVEKLKIKDKNTDKEYTFVTKQWVRMETDHDYWREFPVKRENSSQTLAVQDYFVDVYTGQKERSGSNVNVHIQIVGQYGDTGWRHLHGSKTSVVQFETGAHDVFRVNAVDLGKLNKVKVKHDGQGPGASWYLDKVEVKESEEANVVYLFECDRWLDEERDDGAVERELILTAVITINSDEAAAKDDEASQNIGTYTPQQEEKPKAGDWLVFVTTSIQPGSGTDAAVTLTLIGDKGSTGPIHLGTESKKSFETGMTDQFDIWVDPSSVGEVKKVRLEHDNSGINNSWRVDKLVLEDLFGGKTYTINVNRLLSDKEKDGDTVFEGVVSTLNKPALKVQKYLVKTVTETEKDAGTNANVYINIIGSEGDCGKRFLRHNIDGSKKFDSGKTNSFLIEAVDLGDIEKIVIGHDGTGHESSWKLLCVMIRAADSQTKETCVFPWGKWLTEEQREATIVKGAIAGNDSETEDR